MAKREAVDEGLDRLRDARSRAEQQHLDNKKNLSRAIELLRRAYDIFDHGSLISDDIFDFLDEVE